MQYRHAPAADHGALDAVLVSAPGRPTLPVRLTLEMFGRALSFAGPDPVTLWDPCCGAGTTLAVLGLCRGPALSGLVGTDVDPSPLDLARRNLALLAPGGLDARADELEALAAQYDKPGYSEAAAAARRLTAPPVPYELAVADVTEPAATAALVERHHPRVVIADLPHGVQTRWSGGGAVVAADGGGSGHGFGSGPSASAGPTAPGHDGAGPSPVAGPITAGHGTGAGDAAAQLAAALASALAPDAVIAMAGRGRKLALPPGTRALDRFRVGHRAVAIVRAGDVRPR